MGLVGFSLRKALLSAAVGTALVVGLPNQYTSKVCAQSLEAREAREQEKDEPKPRLDAKLSLDLGGYFNSAYGRQTPSFTGGGRIQLQYERLFEFQGRATYFRDLHDRSADPVKLPDWFRGEATVESYPIRLRMGSPVAGGAYAGLAGRVRYIENSPSSEEKSVYSSVLPTFRYEEGRLTLRFGVGPYYYWLELDDDHPAKLGIDRSDLVVESFGIACRVDVSYKAETWRGTASGELNVDRNGTVREASARLEFDLFLEELLGSRPTDQGRQKFERSCCLILRFSGEARYFDFLTRERVTKFDHDLAVGSSLVLEFD